jgi:hypothetical protein
LPAFSAERLFLVFTKGITFSIVLEGGGYGEKWCGFHDQWDDGQYYALCPYPSATGCGADTPLASWQSVTSHEIEEATTDPKPGSGWDEASGEGGDVCAWQEVALPFGTVQRFADNRQSACSVWTRRNFAQGTPIAALSRNPNQMDLFAVGLDGGIYSPWWNGDWHDIFRVGWFHA